MTNIYGEMITVKEYAETLRYNPADESSMMRVEDYVASIRTQSVQAQTSEFITVKDYVQALNNERYLTPAEEELASRIEESISSKAAKTAKELEKLLA